MNWDWLIDLTVNEGPKQLWEGRGGQVNRRLLCYKLSLTVNESCKTCLRSLSNNLYLYPVPPPHDVKSVHTLAMASPSGWTAKLEQLYFENPFYNICNPLRQKNFSNYDDYFFCSVSSVCSVIKSSTWITVVFILACFFIYFSNVVFCFSLIIFIEQVFR